MPIGRDDLLVERNRLAVVLFLARQSGADQSAAQRTGLAAHGVAQIVARKRTVARPTGKLRELAVIMRHLARLRSAQYLELTKRVDRFLPLLLALVDANELLERGLRKRRALAQLAEELLCAIEQARSQVILGEREQRLVLLRFVEVRPRQQILVDADRTLHLASPAEKVTQGEMGFEGIVIDFRHLHEQLERFVRAAIQHHVQPANIVGADSGRQIAVAVAVNLVDETERTEHDEQCGQKERSVSWHGLGGRWARAELRLDVFQILLEAPFFPGRAPQRDARGQQAEQPPERQR